MIEIKQPEAGEFGYIYINDDTIILGEKGERRFNFGVSGSQYLNGNYRPDFMPSERHSAIYQIEHLLKPHIGSIEADKLVKLILRVDACRYQNMISEIQENRIKRGLW